VAENRQTVAIVADQPPRLDPAGGPARRLSSRPRRQRSERNRGQDCGDQAQPPGSQRCRGARKNFSSGTEYGHDGLLPVQELAGLFGLIARFARRTRRRGRGQVSLCAATDGRGRTIRRCSAASTGAASTGASPHRRDCICLRPHLGSTEPGHVMPDPLEGLLVVPACARCVADDPRIETAVTGERYAESHKLRTPILGVQA
jgi:hypothetical protein